MLLSPPVLSCALSVGHYQEDFLNQLSTISTKKQQFLFAGIQACISCPKHQLKFTELIRKRCLVYELVLPNYKAVFSFPFSSFNRHFRQLQTLLDDQDLVQTDMDRDSLIQLVKRLFLYNLFENNVHSIIRQFFLQEKKKYHIRRIN